MANSVGGQEKQRDYIILRANNLSLQGSTSFFALKQGVFVPCDHLSAKGPFTWK